MPALGLSLAATALPAVPAAAASPGFIVFGKAWIDGLGEWELEVSETGPAHGWFSNSVAYREVVCIRVTSTEYGTRYHIETDVNYAMTFIDNPTGRDYVAANHNNGVCNASDDQLFGRQADAGDFVVRPCTLGFGELCVAEAVARHHNLL